LPRGQIFDQTWRALKDRAHPYRQHLVIVPAGRTLVLDKASGFSPADVEENLCVLLLMLPSANRETKDQLMFAEMAEDDPNGLEHAVASYLDAQDGLYFWYRNASRHDSRCKAGSGAASTRISSSRCSHERAPPEEPFSKVFVNGRTGLISYLTAADSRSRLDVFT